MNKTSFPTNTENARDAPSHLHIVSRSWGCRRCSHLYTTSCQAGGCTWGDTCISGRSPCPRSCAGSLRCHGCKSLRVTCSHKHRNKEISAALEELICVCVGIGRPTSTYRCSPSGSWPARTLDGTRRPRPLWASPCRCGRSRALYSYS